MTQSVTDTTFQFEVLNATVPVLVDFWAPWCGPCRMLGPILEDLAQEMGDLVKVVKIDIDENPDAISYVFDTSYIGNSEIFQASRSEAEFAAPFLEEAYNLLREADELGVETERERDNLDAIRRNVEAHRNARCPEEFVAMLKGIPIIEVIISQIKSAKNDYDDIESTEEKEM